VQLFILQTLMDLYRSKVMSCQSHTTKLFATANSFGQCTLHSNRAERTKPNKKRHYLPISQLSCRKIFPWMSTFFVWDLTKFQSIFTKTIEKQKNNVIDILHLITSATYFFPFHDWIQTFPSQATFPRLSGAPWLSWLPCGPC